METDWIIRPERPEDRRETETLVREAFWNRYRPGCTEHFVLHRYRTDPAFVPELDFVMEERGRLVGQIVFSRASLALDGGGTFPVWTFGPLAIHPDCQRRGLGLALLDHALEAARGMGVGAVCMEGALDFYRHAGFDLASKLHLHCDGEPPDAEVPYFLARELVPGFLRGVEGSYRTPRGYFAADDDPAGFAAFEATFPPKEKALGPGQLPQSCQSCGMPLARNEDCGTEADGGRNFDYCKCCYAGGRFLRDFTMEEMIDHCAGFLDGENKHLPSPVSEAQYRERMRAFFPRLKRWRTPPGNAVSV
ncbi:MAG: GNAT family N-acetyltransferase [Kiritimatiellae bacterium]|nr:GNAT family N-acetyltransferase [Kiritimatiellia bacterium]